MRLADGTELGMVTADALDGVEFHLDLLARTELREDDVGVGGCGRVFDEGGEGQLVAWGES